MSWMRKARQAGFTLVEVSIVSIIMAIAMTGFARWYSETLRVEAGRILGDQMLLVNNAVQTYTINNYSPLASAAPAITGFVDPMAPTMAELRAAGILPVGVPDQATTGANYVIRITKTPAGCTPPACDLATIVYLDQPVMNVRTGTPDLPKVGAAVNRIGANGGFSSVNTANVIDGANGAWSIPNPIGAQAGVLAVRGGYGASGMDQFLRADGGKAITKVANIGDACNGNGFFGIDGGGRFLTCQGGAFKLANGSGSITQTATKGGVCTENGALAKSVTDTTEILICSAGTWGLGAGNNVVLRDGTRAMTGDFNLGGNNVSNANNVTATGRVTGSSLLPTQVITASAACPTGTPQGTAAQDNQGVWYSCQGGVWKKATGAGGGLATVSSVLESMAGKTLYVYYYHVIQGNYYGTYAGYMTFYSNQVCMYPASPVQVQAGCLTASSPSVIWYGTNNYGGSYYVGLNIGENSGYAMVGTVCSTGITFNTLKSYGWNSTPQPSCRASNDFSAIDPVNFPSYVTPQNIFIGNDLLMSKANGSALYIYMYENIGILFQ
jgi:prepilin-type N-terminal cleavage/methylation domain-containing protein